MHVATKNKKREERFLYTRKKLKMEREKKSKRIGKSRMRIGLKKYSLPRRAFFAYSLQLKVASGSLRLFPSYICYMRYVYFIYRCNNASLKGVARLRKKAFHSNRLTSPRTVKRHVVNQMLVIFLILFYSIFFFTFFTFAMMGYAV